MHHSERSRLQRSRRIYALFQCVDPSASLGITPSLGILHRFRKPELFLKLQRCFEKVAVDREGEVAFLQLHQALSDVQTKAAAFRIAGGIAPDKPLQQLLCGNVQRFFGNVFLPSRGGF